MLQAAFSHGISQAAHATTALVVTGGTNSGVMRLTGKALGDSDHKVQCLGIATWGVINGRKDLEGCHDLRKEIALERTQRNSSSGVNLEPNHTHFLLVDSGKTGEKDGQKAWGGEIAFRFALEKARYAASPTLDHSLLACR